MKECMHSGRRQRLERAVGLDYIVMGVSWWVITGREERVTLSLLIKHTAPLCNESYAPLSEWLRAALIKDVADIAMQYFAGVACKPSAQ